MKRFALIPRTHKHTTLALRYCRRQDNSPTRPGSSRRPLHYDRAITSYGQILEAPENELVIRRAHSQLSRKLRVLPLTMPGHVGTLGISCSERGVVMKLSTNFVARLRAGPHFFPR